MSKVLRIERTELRPGHTEVDQAYVTPNGYVLAAPGFSGEDRKQAENATIVATLEEAAELIEKRGFYIRMGNKPVRDSLIQPSKVRIVRSCISN